MSTTNLGVGAISVQTIEALLYLLTVVLLAGSVGRVGTAEGRRHSLHAETRE
ncbi:MAG: hypothetical protein ACREXY_05320 [Gammaproteobacteria bacterium]